MKHCQPITQFLLKLFLLGSSLLFHAFSGSAQSWQQLLSELSETEDFEHTSWEDYEEDLEEWAQHPINLNAATREEMERLPFLTPSQVEDIQAYVYRYGGMKSMTELTLIPSISWYQRQLMEHFFYVDADQKKSDFPSIRNIIKYGKHEAMGMLKVPFYERKGDVNGYMGYKYKHWLRYQFRYGDYVKLGVVGSQDAGEPFGTGKNNLGYDFYSFYLQVKKLGRWKNITLGRYRLHEGLGLILNNDFSFGKLSVLSSLGSATNRIRVHSSRSSANYLQGAAATYTLLKGLDLTAFFSYRKIDATLSDKGGIQTIQKTGLHRTLKEIAKQNIASNTLMGGNINYRNQGWHIGATGFYTSFSLPLTPDQSQLYKRFAPQGYNFWNASVDYGYVSHRWTIAGETATGIVEPSPPSMPPPISFPTISLCLPCIGSIPPAITRFSATAFQRGAMCRMRMEPIWALRGFRLIAGASPAIATLSISCGPSIILGRARNAGTICSISSISLIRDGLWAPDCAIRRRREPPLGDGAFMPPLLMKTGVPRRVWIIR